MTTNRLTAQNTAPCAYVFDPGRVLTEEERRELEGEYTYPRPERKLCRVETDNNLWRLGKV